MSPSYKRRIPAAPGLLLLSALALVASPQASAVGMPLSPAVIATIGASDPAANATASDPRRRRRQLGCGYNFAKKETVCGKGGGVVARAGRAAGGGGRSGAGSGGAGGGVGGRGGSPGGGREVPAAPAPATATARTSFDFCRALTGDGQPPKFAAVIARWNEDVGWTKRLPMPVLVNDPLALRRMRTWAPR